MFKFIDGTMEGCFESSSSSILEYNILEDDGQFDSNKSRNGSVIAGDACLSSDGLLYILP